MKGVATSKHTNRTSSRLTHVRINHGGGGHGTAFKLATARQEWLSFIPYILYFLHVPSPVASVFLTMHLLSLTILAILCLGSNVLADGAIELTEALAYYATQWEFQTLAATKMVNTDQKSVLPPCHQASYPSLLTFPPKSREAPWWPFHLQATTHPSRLPYPVRCT